MGASQAGRIALNPGEVEEIVVAQGNIVRPEDMVQHAAGFAQPFAHMRNTQSAAAAVAGANSVR